MNARIWDFTEVPKQAGSGADGMQLRVATADDGSITAYISRDDGMSWQRAAPKHVYVQEQWQSTETEQEAAVENARRLLEIGDRWNAARKQAEEEVRAEWLSPQWDTDGAGFRNAVQTRLRQLHPNPNPYEQDGLAWGFAEALVLAAAQLEETEKRHQVAAEANTSTFESYRELCREIGGLQSTVRAIERWEVYCNERHGRAFLSVATEIFVLLNAESAALFQANGLLADGLHALCQTFPLDDTGRICRAAILRMLAIHHERIQKLYGMVTTSPGDTPK